MEIKHHCINLLILFSFIMNTNANEWDCIYNMYVQTGDIPYAGTSSNITIFLSDNSKAQLPIVNLQSWGLMGPTHTYLRPGQVELFAGKGPCLRGPVCSLIIVLNGFDSWYCDSIQVSAVGFGKTCSQKHFVVKKWFDVNAGTAVLLQDECDDDTVPITRLRRGY